MSSKRLMLCLVLSVLLVFGMSAPAAASGNWIGCASPSYTDWSRGKDWPEWDDWEDYWKEWSKGKDWLNWQSWQESDWYKWSGWLYWWGLFHSGEWLQWQSNWLDGSSSYDALKNHPGSISQFNHPGSVYGDFLDFAYYNEETDALVSLIEVGSGEGAIGSDKYYRSYGDYARALDNGWHLAPTNNQDNRSASFGDANTARTVVLAKKLTRDDLYDAMRNRRVYATEDKDLEIRYTLDGRIMGSIVNTTSDQVRIRVKLKESGNETIGKVSVISSGGEVVTSQTLAVQSYTLDLTLPADRPYYYIRVDQFDKDIAVTAPVWIVKGSSGGSGISKTYASTDDPIKGESQAFLFPF